MDRLNPDDSLQADILGYLDHNPPYIGENDLSTLAKAFDAPIEKLVSTMRIWFAMRHHNEIQASQETYHRALEKLANEAAQIP